MSTASAQVAKALAQQLLEAQVLFIKSRLSSPEAGQYIQGLISFCLEHGQQIQLEQAVSVLSIKQVVQTYVFDLNLGGGLIELIGAMSQQLYNHANQLAPTLSMLINDQYLEQWIDKILELEQVRTQITQAIQQSPAIHDIIAQLTSSLIKKQLPDWRVQAAEQLSTRWLAKTSFITKLNKTLAQQEAKLLGMAEQHIAQFIQTQSGQLLNLENDELKDMVWLVWQNIKHIPINELSSGVAALDIEEFFVLMYDSWRHLRQTDYMQQMILTGVDIFFEVYGQYPVTELLEEIGIKKQHLINDANRFLPQLIAVLNENDVLDQLIRLQISGFYNSAETLELIEINLVLN